MAIGSGEKVAGVQAIHSDPDDGELVSVVKEALAHLDHALLERGWKLMVGKGDGFDWWTPP